MKRQNFEFILAIVTQLTCLISGTPQYGLKGISVEAPLIETKSDTGAKLTFDEFHNKLAPLFEIIPKHLPLAKLRYPNEFKEYLKTELLYDAPEDVLYDARDTVSAVYGVVESLVSCLPGGSIITGVLDLFGIKDAVINLFGGEPKREEDMEREVLLEEVKRVLKSAERMLGGLFEDAVTETVNEAVNEAIRSIEKFWKHREGILLKRLSKKSKLNNGGYKQAPTKSKTYQIFH